MILAYHVILSAYGFWLPNDPRGSWSDFVASWDLYRYAGGATRVRSRRSFAYDQHDVSARQSAKRQLLYPPVTFDERQIVGIGKGFAQAIGQGSYHCHACAILPDHCHLVLGRSARSIEQVAGHLKANTARELSAAGCHPFQDVILADGKRPSMWGERSWRVYIDDERHLSAAIDYVIRNPEKEGRDRQCWSFVTAVHGSQASRLNGEG